MPLSVTIRSPLGVWGLTHGPWPKVSGFAVETFHSAPDALNLLLGGSWVVISRVISRITVVITYIGGLITLLITTHEPSSGVLPQHKVLNT